MEIKLEQHNIRVINKEGDVILDVEDVIPVPGAAGFVTYKTHDTHGVNYMMVPGDMVYSTQQTIETEFNKDDYVYSDGGGDDSEQGYVLSAHYNDDENKVYYRVQTEYPNGRLGRIATFYEEDLALKPEDV